MQIPGFVDLQVNGYLGVDFSDKNLTAEDCADACRKLLAHGTAAFLPTIITSEPSLYRRNLSILADIIEDNEFAGRILGIHVEGPFISKYAGAVGVHNSVWVKRPSLKFFDQMQRWARGHIKMVTLAAEVKGADCLTRSLVKQGVVVSLGHQMAACEDLARLADAGAACLTHLGNGMPNMVHRHENPLMFGLAEDRLIGMIIADGFHLPPFVLKTIIRAKTVRCLIITSDASPIAGCKPGIYQTLGNRAILRADGLLHNPDKRCLVGSSFTILECVNWLLRKNLLNADELIEVCFKNPLRLLKIHRSRIKTNMMVKHDKRANQYIVRLKARS